MGFMSGAKRCTYEGTASPAGGRSSLAGCGERAIGQVSMATGHDLRNIINALQIWFYYDSKRIY